MRAVRSIPDRVPSEKRTLGWAVLDWSAEYLLQPDGPNAGQRWQFTREQVRIVLRFGHLACPKKFREGMARILTREGCDAGVDEALGSDMK